LPKRTTKFSKEAFNVATLLESEQEARKDVGTGFTDLFGKAGDTVVVAEVELRIRDE
jgi:hypothetical protein